MRNPERFDWRGTYLFILSAPIVLLQMAGCRPCNWHWWAEGTSNYHKSQSLSLQTRSRTTAKQNAANYGKSQFKTKLQGHCSINASVISTWLPTNCLSRGSNNIQKKHISCGIYRRLLVATISNRNTSLTRLTLLTAKVIKRDWNLRAHHSPYFTFSPHSTWSRLTTSKRQTARKEETDRV